MSKKIYILGCSGIPARYGGFETYAENLSLSLSTKHEVFVICSNRYYSPSERSGKWKGINRVFLPLNSNGFLSIFYDLISLIYAEIKSDSIIILGSGAGFFLLFMKMISRTPVSVHIDGIEWKRKKWNLFTKYYLWLNTRLSIKCANHIILDNEALISLILNKYIPKIIFSGYGGDHLSIKEAGNSTVTEPYALVIARAEPENNLDMILETFARVGSLMIIVISNWKQTKHGRLLMSKFSNYKNILLMGPIYDDRSKIQGLRTNCKLYIHGHSAGGTNPSLVEAMYSGRPVFAFDNLFNRETTKNEAFYFNNSNELTELLNKVDAKQLKHCSQKMTVIAHENYTWNKMLQPVKDIL